MSNVFKDLIALNHWISKLQYAFPFSIHFIVFFFKIMSLLQTCTLRRQIRTLYASVPENAQKEAHSLFVQEVRDRLVSDKRAKRMLIKIMH